MSFDTENGENIITDSKQNEEIKSPGRLAAEERAEKIRYAAEYRSKLEAEKIPVPPKKTKAAEQKEQEKIAKAEAEQAEKQAWLEEQKLESERRILAAKEKLGALEESIQKTESEPVVVQTAQTVAAPTSGNYTVTAEYQPPKRPEPVKLAGNLVLSIPVQSFTIPCEVKYTKKTEVDSESSELQDTGAQQQYEQYMQYVQHLQQCAQPMYYPPMMPPPVYMPPQPITVCCPAAQQPQPAPIYVLPSSEEPVKRNPALPCGYTQITRRRPKPTIVPRQNSALQTQVDNSAKTFGNDPIYRPSITYGVVVTEGGWEDEIYDEEAEQL